MLWQRTLLYGVETWTIIKAKEKKLLAAKMDYWRRTARIYQMENKENTEIEKNMTGISYFCSVIPSYRRKTIDTVWVWQKNEF